VENRLTENFTEMSTPNGPDVMPPPPSPK